VGSSEDNLAFEDQTDIESLREEIRLAKALIALQASKIHALEASANPTSPQTLEPASQERQSPRPSPGSREKSRKSGRSRCA